MKKTLHTTPDEVVTSSSTYNSSNGYSINKEELNTFKKANDILAMRSPEKRAENSNANTNSTVNLFSKRQRYFRL